MDINDVIFIEEVENQQNYESYGSLNSNDPLKNYNNSCSKFSKEATARLLEMRGSSRYVMLFNNKKTSKAHLWNKIAEELLSEGFDFGTGKAAGEKCRQKFSNLQKGYVIFINNMKQTGAGAIDKPWYFELIDNILGDKHKISPPMILDSESCNEIISFANLQNGLPLNPIPGPSGVKAKKINAPISLNESVSPKTPITQTPKKNRFEQSKLHVKPTTKTAAQVLQDIHSSTETALQENKKMFQTFLDKQVEFQEKDEVFKTSLLKMVRDFLQPSKKRRRKDSSSSDD